MTSWDKLTLWLILFFAFFALWALVYLFICERTERTEARDASIKAGNVYAKPVVGGYVRVWIVQERIRPGVWRCAGLLLGGGEVVKLGAMPVPTWWLLDKCVTDLTACWSDRPKESA